MSALLCRALHIPTGMYGMANRVERFGQNKHRTPGWVGSTRFNEANTPHEIQPDSPTQLAQPAHLLAKRRSAAQPMRTCRRKR